MEVDINVKLEQNIFFNETNNYEIGIKNLVNKCPIKNNIFGYEMAGIKIISSLDEENGFYNYSKEIENKITNNQIISTTDSISFKLISEIGIKLDEYSIEYEIIIKEQDCDTFISNTALVELFPKNDSNNHTLYESFYEPNTFSGWTSFINFTINECYETCQSCNSFGDIDNQHCLICSQNYNFSYSTSNGNNCVKKCPDNYEILDNNIWKKNQEESDIGTNKIEEINKSGMISDEFFDNIKEKINEQNKWEQYFYLDENMNINCFNGDTCIDAYRHLNKIIKNLWTNCIYKYKNKCYMEFPKNTCIKQDINLDTCIDINESYK